MNANEHEWDFEKLVGVIRQVHEEMAAQARKAVNLSLTMRNWLIGGYIAEYELSGADRAAYGENLLKELSRELRRHEISNSGRRQLYNYLALYRNYPQIVRTVSAQTRHMLPQTIDSKTVRTASAQLGISPEKLLGSLSYSHFEQLSALEDDLKRSFYEIECVRGNCSVRELKRQIGSLYYERSGLSKDKRKLAELAQKGTDAAEPKLAIQDPYISKFLGPKSREVMSESHLEVQLLDKLQDFLLEVGHGFCFEARQERILIGDTHNVVDLVFSQRVLKCHVLVQLKLEQFGHENIGQLNTYASWYNREYDDPRRQSAHRHPSLHPVRSYAGGIRAGRDGQRPFRFQVPA
jgi:predicted nuclease of restriction endonuclease-like (RecB) superfamily